MSKNIFVGILKVTNEKSRSPWHGFADTDPYKNATDPEHW